MNTIEELIQKECPEGVDYIFLKDICEIGTGSQDRKDAIENGQYPFFVRSQEVLKIDRFLYDEEAIIIPGEGGIGNIFHYIKGKYGLHQRAYRIHPISSIICTKFLYYYMSSNFKDFIFKKAVSATVTSIRKPMLELFEIPVPPLSVQHKIVEILDKFTSLEAELEAELEARKKQYEYYRNQLLDFTGREDVEWKTIGDLCDVIVGGEPPANCQKGQLEPTEDYKYAVYGNGKEVYGYADTYIIDKDSMVISSIGANTGAVFFHKAFFTPIIRLKVLVPKSTNLLPKYLYYFGLGMNFKSKQGGIPNINTNDVKRKIIALPPLSEQQRIVTILDKFEELINGQTASLAAEIKARHQQYEYYRDKLLSFKRKD